MTASDRPRGDHAYDDEWESCPNCITPWKCNGPHTPSPPATDGDAADGGTR